jgi:hypothetical protein
VSEPNLRLRQLSTKTLVGDCRPELAELLGMTRAEARGYAEDGRLRLPALRVAHLPHSVWHCEAWSGPYRQVVARAYGRSEDEAKTRAIRKLNEMS